ncbi:MAG: hypothetical protein J0I41_22335 [Filimonas sp.]|nr:hypothetical protein [Filimonas sp.]
MNQYAQEKIVPSLIAEVLSKYGKHNLLPSDCKNLSNDIIKVTGFTVSETTLKRIMGFARKSFEFSSYTLEALALYSGYKSLAGFAEKAGNTKTADTVKLKTEIPATVNIACSEDALQTLLSVKNSSGIPFSETIERKDFNSFIKKFMSSKQRVAPVIGPAGSGKSIALAHAVQSLWLNEKAPFKETCLYLHAHCLYQLIALKTSFSEWISALNPSGNLVMVIDSFDERCMPMQKLKFLFDKLTSLATEDSDKHNVKIIIAMRPSCWRSIMQPLNGKQSVDHLLFMDKSYPQYDYMHQALPFTDAEQDLLLAGHLHLSAHISTSSAPFVSLLKYPAYMEQVYNLWLEKNEFNEDYLAMQIVRKQAHHFFNNGQSRLSQFHYLQRIVERNINNIDSTDAIEEDTDSFAALTDHHFLQPNESTTSTDVSFSSVYFEDYFTVLSLFIPQYGSGVEDLLELIFYNSRLCDRKRQLLKWIAMETLYNRNTNLWNLARILESPALNEKDKREVSSFVLHLSHENPFLSPALMHLPENIFTAEARYQRPYA